MDKLLLLVMHDGENGDEWSGLDDAGYRRKLIDTEYSRNMGNRKRVYGSA